MLADGHRLFVMGYHSPSLQPGNTPYVRTAADLQLLLAWIEGYLDFFLGEIGGRLGRPDAIYDAPCDERDEANVSGLVDV